MKAVVLCSVTSVDITVTITAVNFLVSLCIPEI